MKSAAWTKALRNCADPERAKHFFELWLETGQSQAVSQEQATVFSALFSGSEALSTCLIAHPQWAAALKPSVLRFPRRRQGLRMELAHLTQKALAGDDFSSAFSELREFKQREMLRIGARDLARYSNVPEITQELSDLADVCLAKVWEICWLQLRRRYGQPWHQDASGQWQSTEACVLGLGKLGGQELNYSSDVDLMFAYTDEGQVFREPPPERSRGGAAKTPPPQRPVLTNHQFFDRLAEAFVTEVTRMAPEGALYRVDLRLRPEGDAGPLSRSLSGYENYYAQWGQTWERMMLIKTRGVAGDESLAAEFLEMIQPFRYPRSVNPSVLREVGAMKDRIENEVVKAGELERNVKLGRGGIREVEFIVQSLQLLHAGRQPFLQGSQTLPCLQKLVQYELLPASASGVLADAYCFLRELEHRLQMEGNLQTHTIPTDKSARLRLARLMGAAGVSRAVASARRPYPREKLSSPRTLKDFDATCRKHREGVRRIFERVLKTDRPETRPAAELPRQFEGAEAEWKRLLAEHAFREPDRALRVLREFVQGPGYVHVSPRTAELALNLIPRLFALCPGPEYRQRRENVEAAQGSESVPGAGRIPLSDPDRVVTRLDSFISSYGARGTLFELWNSNPGIFDLLLRLFDRSEFLAELAIRTPDLVDELVTSGRLRQRKTSEETLRDLRHGLNDEDQHLWLRKYHQAELMRIGLRDILGLADFEQYLTELSALADACLKYALEVVMRKHRLKAAPFVIIGLGKLGGAEIDYGSDLDIVFVAESTARDLAKLSRLAVEVMDLVSTRTEHGLLFQTDARLRPDGEKGMVVNTLRAYEEYYRHRAQLWEIQSLTRTRPVAGHSRLGEQFQHLAATLTNFQKPSLPLAAYSENWLEKIDHMRRRIEKERTPSGKDDLAIKTGAGGLMDAEFIAQALCLRHGWQRADTLGALEQGRQVGVLPQGDKLIENYRKLRRVEGILRRWSYEGETVLPDDPAPYYRVSVRCGFPSPEAFRQALADWRRAIRQVYQAVFRFSGSATWP